MINRTAVKLKAKEFLKYSYIKNVAVAFILMIALYSFYSSGGSTAVSRTDREVLEQLSSRALLIIGGMICVSSLIVLLVRIFVLKPVEVGCRKYFLYTYKGEQPVGTIFSAFHSSYLNIVKTMFFKDLFLLLWSLLFIVPGIIKSYSYRMIPYLLAENPDMSTEEAFETSKSLMNGRKMETFIYDLSFIGWYILIIITCSLVGIFYVNPYKALADAQLYITFRYGTQPDGTINS